MQKITPFLWFNDQAEEAARFYVSIFKNSKIHNISRYPKDSPGTEGKVMVVNFELDGQQFISLNGGPIYTFNEAISFQIECKDQVEVDHYWENLTSGGEPIQCGWLKDKFGVSWQVVPIQLGELMSDPDPDKVYRVNQAMLKMVKLDIAKLQAAFEG
jgi:predicted 3-demethylubiquinone-9 3-methyltransferase (glyoxalase superfamily)